MRIFILLALVSLLTACADLQKKEQLEKINLLSTSLDSLENIVKTEKIDTLASLKFNTSAVELRIKTYLVSDKIDTVLAHKMNAYKRMRRALNPLGNAYGKVKSGILEERTALKNLKADIENGYGEREKYDEYIAFEKEKINKLNQLFTDFMQQKESIFSTYELLHNELNDFSMVLLDKYNKKAKK